MGSIESIFTLVTVLGIFSVLCVVYIIMLYTRTCTIKAHYKKELEKKSLIIEELKKNNTEKETQLRTRTTQAFLSPVSGLPNLLGSQARIDDMFARLERGKVEKATVIGIDLYKFKPINDLYGHKNGDKVLKIAGEVLFSVTRPEDIVIHLHGDEFAIICADTDVEEIEAILARANTALLEYDFTFAKEGTVNTKYSFGIAESNKYLKTFEKLYKIADLKCMKIKKGNGESR